MIKFISYDKCQSAECNRPACDARSKASMQDIARRAAWIAGKRLLEARLLIARIVRLMATASTETF